MTAPFCRRTTRLRPLQNLVWGVGLALVVGCAAGAPSHAARMEGSESPPAEENTVELAPLSTVDGAIADLATRMSVDASVITVVSVDSVTWPNTALGCPQPGRAYAQVMRPGQRIVLAIGDTRYAYHATDGPAFFCPNPA